MEDCYDCDLIIESLPEDIAKKKSLFCKLQKICKTDSIFATNTSSLSITEMSEDIHRGVIGMHFFNPAPVMKLVEVIPGLNTPPDVTERVKQICISIGKYPIKVEDRPGFAVNCILIPMINEAIGMLAEGVATAKDIDTSMKLGGANHPMGPLQLGDYIGLDVCLAIMETLQTQTGNCKYSPHPLLRKMVQEGNLGRKTGRGFYVYGERETEKTVR